MFFLPEERVKSSDLYILYLYVGLCCVLFPYHYQNKCMYLSEVESMIDYSTHKSTTSEYISTLCSILKWKERKKERKKEKYYEYF